MAETFTTTFVVDGVESQVITNTGNMIEMPAQPKKSGFTFSGWYTMKVGGTKVLSFTTAQTVYAQFQKNEESNHPDYNPPYYPSYIPEPQDKTIESMNVSGITAVVPKEVTNVVNPRLDVVELPQGSAIAVELAKAAKGYDILKTFDINLYDATTRIEKVEGGKIKVMIPFNGTVGLEYVVLHYNKDRIAAVLPAIYLDGKIIFETDSFSAYAIAVKSEIISQNPITEVPQTGTASPTYVPAILLLLATIAITFRKRLVK